jgi:transcriptional regulator with XRE-family HTH domain
MSNIGDKIKQYRKKNGLSQRALSKQIGIEHSLIARYENGQRTPSMRSNKVICDIIGLDPMTLEPIDIYHNSMYSELCDLVVGYDELSDERLVLIQEKAFNRFLRKYWDELKCTKAKD